MQQRSEGRKCFGGFAMVLYFLVAALFLAPKFGLYWYNWLPWEESRALADAEQVTLYSLEDHAFESKNPPGETLQGFKVLGSAMLTGTDAHKAVQAFQDAVKSGTPITGALCFEPHHALRIDENGHRYDYLLCYGCGWMYVYKDNQLVSTVGITGRSEVLNGLLTAAHVPLAHIYSPEYLAQAKKEAQAAEDADARWLANMPESIRPLWTSGMNSGYPGTFIDSNPHPYYDPNHSVSDRRNAFLKPFHEALDRQFPDENARILALMKWYGSGAGPWSGYPAGESIAAGLLMDYPTPELLKAIQSVTLSEAQLNGAARLFGEDMALYRSGDLKLLPADLKKTLLAEAIKTNPPGYDNAGRARKAFQ